MQPTDQSMFLSRDLNLNSIFLGGLIAGALGLWLGVAEVLFHLPFALAGSGEQVSVLTVAIQVPRSRLMDSIYENLAGLGLLTLACWALIMLAAVIVASVRGGARPGPTMGGALFACSSLLLIFAGWFHLGGAWGGAWSGFKAPLFVLPALAFLVWRQRYCKRLPRERTGPVLVVQGFWLMGALVLVGSLLELTGRFSLPVRLGMALAPAPFLYLGVRLCLRLALLLFSPGRLRGALTAAGVTLGWLLLVFSCWQNFIARERLPAVEGGASGRPNIALIVLDTVRADRLSLYGHSRRTTPFLDRLAGEGAVFTRAYTPSPWTLPAHASMFTGLYPSEHNCLHGHYFLDPRFSTLADKLRARGYLTLGLSANPWISRFTNLDQGFDLLLHPRSLHISPSRFVGQHFLRGLFFVVRPARDDGAREMNAIADRWFSRLSARGRPFFLFINYMEAHLPYPEEPEAFAFFPDREQAPKLLAEIDFNWIAFDAGYQELTESELELLRTWYDGAIHYLDRRLEELDESLARHGLRGNTAVIVVSDHGELIGEHGMWCHSFSLYHGLLHVPLVIRFPGVVEPGTRVEEFFSIKELHELALSAAAGGPLSALDPVPEPGGEPRLIFSERRSQPQFIERIRLYFPDFDETRFDRDQRSVISYPYHLILDSRGEDELYHLSRDPGERENLTELEPVVYHRLALLLREFAATRQAVFPDSIPGVIVDPESLERLRQLGYIK